MRIHLRHTPIALQNSGKGFLARPRSTEDRIAPVRARTSNGLSRGKLTRLTILLDAGK